MIISIFCYYCHSITLFFLANDILMDLLSHFQTTTVTEKYCQPIYTISEAYRVVADHIRALSFAIADGATFGMTLFSTIISVLSCLK